MCAEPQAQHMECSQQQLEQLDLALGPDNSWLCFQFPQTVVDFVYTEQLIKVHC